MAKKKEDADELFMSSAKYKEHNEDPINCLTGFSPVKRYTFKEKISNFFRKIRGDILNKKNEIIEQKRLNGLSDSVKKNEGIREYLDYYRLLYVSKSADHEKLQKLISSYGIPDGENPYNKDSMEYDQYHPDGFIAAEFNAILSYVIYYKDLADEYDAEFNEDNDLIVSEYSLKLKTKKYYLQALKSLTLIFYHCENFAKITNKIHKDNIEVVVMEIIFNFNFSSEVNFSRDQFVSKISQLGIAPEHQIKKLISTMK